MVVLHFDTGKLALKLATVYSHLLPRMPKPTGIRVYGTRPHALAFHIPFTTLLRSVPYTTTTSIRYIRVVRAY